MKILKLTTSLLALSSVILAMPAMAQEKSAPKWGGHIELEGKLGNDRDLGEAGIFLPLHQNEESMIFTDIRGRFDNSDSQEYNLGLGYRKIINDDLILGGYGFYDHRRTPSNNEIDQLTLGLEALTQTYEARLNAYLPESDEKFLGGTSATVDTSGGNFQMNTVGTSERAMPGFDVELGARFYGNNDIELWGYGGGYHFDTSGYDNVTGPRGRVELSFKNLPFLTPGSRLTAGIETQHDDERGHQTWGLARIRVPFNAITGHSAPRQTGIDARMTSRIYRDVDIVAGEKETTINETGTVSVSGSGAVGKVTFVEAGDNIAAKVDAIGEDSLVILNGSAGVINTSAEIDTKSGQVITSGGINLTVTGSVSGYSTTLNMPGSRATVNGQDITRDIFNLNDDVTISAIDLTGGDHAIKGDNVTSVKINDVNINNTNDTAIDLNNTTGAIENVTIDTTGRDGIFAGFGSQISISDADITGTNDSGIFMHSSVVTLSDSYIHGTTGNGIYTYQAGSDLTMNDTIIEDTGSDAIYTTNTKLSGAGNEIIAPVAGSACFNNDGNTGSIAFDDIEGGGAGTCP
ncbi:MAG: inverse autotransporter beta domain-containing protein [Pseudomonadota bacterium]